MANTNKNENLVPSRSYIQRVKDYVKTIKLLNGSINLNSSVGFETTFSRWNLEQSIPLSNMWRTLFWNHLKLLKVNQLLRILQSLRIHYRWSRRLWRTFFLKPTVINLLKSHYEFKVKINLHCIMERCEVRSGAIITANPAFHSDPMVNVKGSVTDDLSQAAR